jgi:CRP-like cAMP-binding protein
MPLNDKELFGVYRDLQRIFREDLHLARSLIQWFQQQNELESARQLAMEMARRMLAIGQASSAIAFLEICKRLECPQKEDIESMMTMAQMSLDDAQTGVGTCFSLIEMLSDHEAMDFIRKANVVNISAGEHVVRQDEISDSFYLILKGEMQVYITLENDQDVYLTTLLAGDYFGEYACVYQLPRSASVKASSDAVLLEFSNAAISELMQQSPEAGEQLMHVVGARLVSSMLQIHPAFESLAKEDKEWLAEESVVVELEDETSADINIQDQCHVIINGYIIITYQHHGHTFTHRLNKYDMFGYAHGIFKLPKGAVLTAHERCLVCHIPVDIFKSFMAAYGDFERWVKEQCEACRQSLGLEVEEGLENC